ncbi:MAG: hypothetical protein HZA37_01260 [Parcubacteria group bacterium]|nr:hypothetical protein [Parcubacteria group bacterium]
MAKGKVCLVLIETKKIRGEDVLAGTILMEGSCAKSVTPEDIAKAVQLGQVQVELRDAKD